MRHRVKGKKLGRTASHKKATMRSLSIALLTHHRIVTTLPKAKELRSYVEPLVNRAKEDTMHNRREVFSFLQDNATVSKIFDEIGPKVGDRQGGYTRVIKMGTRIGDAAQMAIIELVDYNESEVTTAGSKRKRTRRAGKAAKAADTGSQAAVTSNITTAEAEVVETVETELSDVTESVEQTDSESVESSVGENIEEASESDESDDIDKKKED
jgi:large subunit ribosomal protein L17